MARRKRALTRRRTFRGFARKARRRGGIGSTQNLLQVDSIAYGAVRSWTSNMIAPLTSQIPLGGIADEVGMGLLNWMVAKNTSGMLAKIARKGLVIENARLGEALLGGALGGMGTATVNNNNNGGI